MECMDFANFKKLPQKSELQEKFEIPDKRGFEATETRKKDYWPPANSYSYS